MPGGVVEFLLTITPSSVTKWLITAENKVVESSNSVEMFSEAFIGWQSYLLRQKVKGQVHEVAQNYTERNDKLLNGRSSILGAEYWTY